MIWVTCLQHIPVSLPWRWPIRCNYVRQQQSCWRVNIMWRKVENIITIISYNQRRQSIQSRAHDISISTLTLLSSRGNWPGETHRLYSETTHYIVVTIRLCDTNVSSPGSFTTLPVVWTNIIGIVSQKNNEPLRRVIWGCTDSTANHADVVNVPDLSLNNAD